MRGYTAAWVVFQGLLKTQEPADYLLILFLNLANFLVLWVIVARGRTPLPPGILLTVAWLSTLYWTVMPWKEAFPEAGVPHLMIGYFAWLAAIGLLTLAHTGPRAAAPAPGS